MTEKRFSKKEAIKFGWDTTRANLGFFIIFLVVSILIGSFLNGFGDLFEKRLPFLSIIFNLGYILLNIAINIVGIKIALKFCDNDRRPLIEVITFTPKLFIKFAAGYILLSVLIAAGILLLVVPGVYFMLKYQYVLYFIVDRDAGILEAFTRSSDITDGVKWQLLVFLIFLVLINVAGALCFIVGLFVSIPVTMVAAAYVYRRLSGTSPVVVTFDPFRAPVQAQ